MAVTLVAYIIYAAHNDPFFFRAAVAANIAGIIMAGLAALPGFVDWAIGIPSESPAKSHGLRHMLLNVTPAGRQGHLIGAAIR